MIFFFDCFWSLEHFATNLLRVSLHASCSMWSVVWNTNCSRLVGTSRLMSQRGVWLLWVLFRRHRCEVSAPVTFSALMVTFWLEFVNPSWPLKARFRVCDGSTGKPWSVAGWCC